MVSGYRSRRSYGLEDRSARHGNGLSDEGCHELCAACQAVLHDSGRFPDTVMSVVIGDPIPCTAVAVNIAQLRLNRFEGAKLLGPVDAAAMARVDQVLRAVQDL
jgi:mRNA interferase MazF